MARFLYTFLTLLLLTFTSSQATDYAAHSVLSSGKWVKIRVANEGVYQLSPSALSDMGFSNPASVRLFGYNLPILPEENIEDIDDDLQEIPLYRRGDGTLLFYSFGTVNWTRNGSKFTHKNNPYSQYVYYFLTEGTPAAFRTESPSTTPTHTTTTFPERVVIDNDAYSIINSGRTMFESFVYKYNGSNSYDLNTSGITDGNVQIDIQFATTGAATLYVNANGSRIASRTYIAPANYYDARVNTIITSVANSYSGTTNITLNLNATSSLTKGHLDYIRAQYTRNLSMNGVTYLPFRTPDEYNYRATISGADGGTKVWKVTSPAETCEQSGSLSGSNYVCDLTNNGSDEYVAVNINATFPTPEKVADVANQDLHSIQDIEFVIIVPENNRYTAQAQRLADAHNAREGMKCLVVRADQIYNEFSSGTPDATAYRRFMKMLYDKAQSNTSLSAPRNLLLFGACYWDNRLLSSEVKNKSQSDLLLSYESDNSWSMIDSYICEEYFGLLEDGSGANPLKERAQIGIGRIPVENLTTATNVVNKLIRYINNEEQGSWKNTICFMGDDGDQNIHMEDARQVIKSLETKYPNFNYQKIFWDRYQRVQTATGNTYPEVIKLIDQTMQDGALIMNFTGHGSAVQLSHEALIKTENFQKWASKKLPLWFTAACDVTPFDMNKVNQGTEALYNKKGAAMGFVGTARTVYSSQNRVINRYFMNYVLGKNDAGRRHTIGEALTLAKGDIATAKSPTSRDLLNKTHYVLIGDPAITLAAPTYNIKVDKINGTDVSSSNPPTISAGNVVTVSGHIEDINGKTINDYNGTLSPLVFDNIEKITCLNNSQADTAFVYQDRTRKLFIGFENVQNGQFNFSFPVPLDINYSNLNGLISLYATNGTNEAHGINTDFLVGGTGSYDEGGEGPTITAWLNSENFEDGDEVNETPYLFFTLHDPKGINTTGNGLGHDICIIIDNNEQTTYNLNSYFKPATGGYADGTVAFSIPELEEGEHTMIIRAFNVLNQMGTKTIHFTVVHGLKPDIANIRIFGPVYDTAKIHVYSNRRGSFINVNLWIYDVYGKLMYQQSHTGEENNEAYYEFEWNLTSTVGVVPPGIYIARVGLSTSNGEEDTIGKKFLVVGNKK